MIGKTGQQTDTGRIPEPGFPIPEDVSFRINDPARPSLSGFDPGGPAVVAADSSTHRLDPAMTTPRFLEALTTIDGGEPVDWLARPVAASALSIQPADL